MHNERQTAHLTSSPNIKKVEEERTVRLELILNFRAEECDLRGALGEVGSDHDEVLNARRAVEEQQVHLVQGRRRCEGREDHKAMHR